MAERAKTRRKVPAACSQVRLIQPDLDLPQVMLMATVFAGYNVANIFCCLLKLNCFRISRLEH